MIFRLGLVTVCLMAGCSRILGIEELAVKDELWLLDASTGPMDAGGGDGTGSGEEPDWPSGSVPHGWPDEFPQEILVEPNELAAFRFTIDQPGSITGWGLVPKSAGEDAMVRMALYRNTAEDEPGELLVSSPPWPVDRKYVRTEELTVPAGEYWLALVVDTRFTIGQAGGDARVLCFQLLAFDEPLPATFETATCFETWPVNIYITIDPDQNP